MKRTRPVKSFEDFSHSLYERQPELVVVQPDLKPDRWPFAHPRATAIGNLGLYHYGLIYNVADEDKQTRHIEPLFATVQSQYGFGDALERHKRATSTHLAAELRVMQLQLILPETEVYLSPGGSDLEPMTEAHLEAIAQEAKQYQVKPAEFIV